MMMRTILLVRASSMSSALQRRPSRFWAGRSTVRLVWSSSAVTG